jgi:hypothetical protein
MIRDEGSISRTDVSIRGSDAVLIGVLSSAHLFWVMRGVIYSTPADSDSCIQALSSNSTALKRKAEKLMRLNVILIQIIEKTTKSLLDELGPIMS